MRTTFTLDDDVEKKLQEQIRQTGKSFNVVVNETLRLGLAASCQMSETPLKPFRVKARPLGVKPGLSYEETANLLEQAERPAFR